MDYFEEFVKAMLAGEAGSRDEVLRLKARLCKKHRLSRVPTNHEILARVPPEARARLVPLLRNKPVRTLSGVAPVAVMTSPSECPHGRCSYCPGGTSENTPQSYTGQEPAGLRAAMYGYDPFTQTGARIEQLEAIGHPTDKVDLIIMGGTFTSRPPEYQEWFVRRCFDAMNASESGDLRSAQELNEVAEHRCVGLTVETRPDWFMDEQVRRSVDLGATKVELGAQILDDEVLAGVRRGHTVEDLVQATRRAKDAGLKLAYHVMPGLPGSSRDKDLASFRRMFDDDRFRPDMLKIYPTLVIKGTDLYDAWVRGEYTPLSVEETVDLLADMKRHVPPWVRILRVQRDIPVKKIEAGADKSHLRELVVRRLKEQGAPCRCIRCREVGHASGGRTLAAAEIELKDTAYSASGGKEHFVSAEVTSSDALVGYARVRLPSDGMQDEALLRELHVYGQMVPIGERQDGHWQHKGIGEKLLAQSEQIAVDAGLARLRVTSGVGARQYYTRLGYNRDGPYMSKRVSRA